MAVITCFGNTELCLLSPYSLVSIPSFFPFLFLFLNLDTKSVLYEQNSNSKDCHICHLRFSILMSEPIAEDVVAAG